MGVGAKRAKKVESIRASALRLFRERGVADTRMADIAAALGMQAGSLYYYFDSKEDLVISLVAERVRLAVELLERVVAEGAPADVLIRRAIREHLRLFRANADLFHLFHFERLGASAAPVAELGRAYEAVWGDILRSGVESGALSPDIDVAVTVKAIIAMCDSTLGWFEDGGRLDIDQVADQFSRLVLDGVARAP